MPSTTPTPSPTAGPTPAGLPARPGTASAIRRFGAAVGAATLLAVAGYAVPDAGARTVDGGLTTSTRSQEEVTCRGEVAELVTSGTWFGTAERDVVVATGASTEIWASGGDDLVCVVNAGYHGTVVYGGPGEDVIISYGGMNDLYGDGDDDVIIGNGSGEHLEGGDGDDNLKTTGSSYLYGNDGNDRLTGGAHHDQLDGGAGNDQLMGFGGPDTLVGGTGADELIGGAGWDSLDGTPDASTDVCQDVASLVDGADLANCDTVVLTPAAGFGGYAS